MKIISLGLPKCGSLSLTGCLNDAGIKSVHWKTDDGHYVAQEMIRAVSTSRPVFHFLNNYDAVTQMDVCLPPHIGIFPQIDLIELICRQYPKSKFLLPTRGIEGHVQSIIGWNNGDFANRLRYFGITNLDKWIEAHYKKVRLLFAGAKNFYEFDISLVNNDELSDFIGTKVSFPHLNRDHYAHA